MSVDEYFEKLREVEFDIYVLRQIHLEEEDKKEMMKKLERKRTMIEVKIKKLQEEENEKN